MYIKQAVLNQLFWKTSNAPENAINRFFEKDSGLQTKLNIYLI